MESINKKTPYIFGIFIGLIFLALSISTYRTSQLINTHKETKEIVSVYYHQDNRYTVMYIDDNELKSKTLSGYSKRPLRVIVDVKDDEPMYYKIDYTTKGGTPLMEEDGYEYTYEIHIRNPNGVQGGDFKYGKNSYGQTSLVVSTNN